jgi:hypothetical protein
MKPATLIAIVAGVVIPLQAATLAYAVSIERRLTRLETIQEFRASPTRRPAAAPESRT